MTSLISRIFLLFGFFVICVFAQAKVEEPLVRVRLEARISSLEINGKQISLQGVQANYRPIAIPRTESVRVSRVAVRERWFWKVEAWGRVEIKSEPLVEITGVSLSRGALPAPNRLILKERGEGFDVVGVLPIEDYLVGVIASEMPLSWPLESLKAQAIAARSYTLAVMRERSKQLVHVESTIKDQVFRHVVQGVDHDPLVEKAFEAVRQTAGAVLLEPNSRAILKAFYHADCGGKTSSARKVWGSGDSQMVATDSFCETNSKAQWSLRLTDELLTKKLISLMPPAMTASQHLVDMTPLRTDNRSRVEGLKLRFSNGKEEVVLADKFRAALGYAELRSTHFEVSRGPAGWLFKGRGYGHGVGLCQWGSRALALQNKSAQEILNHYYPKAFIGSSKN